MRIVVKTQPIAVSIGIHQLANDFDRMLGNIETLNFRAYEKGLLSDSEQAGYNETIEKARTGMRDFFVEESMEPAHGHAGRYG